MKIVWSASCFLQRYNLSTKPARFADGPCVGYCLLNGTAWLFLRPWMVEPFLSSGEVQQISCPVVLFGVRYHLWNNWQCRRFNCPAYQDVAIWHCCFVALWYFVNVGRAINFCPLIPVCWYWLKFVTDLPYVHKSTIGFIVSRNANGLRFCKRTSCNQK